MRAWPLAALWLALGGGLAVLTTQVADWYVMTDELLYERLALSVTQLHSPLPHVHGELIGNINQLYPLLLAPLLAGRLVPHGLHDAHVLNALVMSSACIPAALLARRVTGSTRLAYVVGVLTVCMPWIALSSFLMTESVAYPAFAWALLALHNAAVSPRPRNDLLLLVAIGVAILARTQFAVLLAIVPLALLLDRFRPRVLVAQHRVLAGAYVALLLAAIGLAAAGELSHALGTYSVTAEGNLTPSGMPRSLLEHLTPLGLGLGIAPFILAVAWPLTALVRELPRDQHAYASIAVVTVAALLFEVTSYDLRFGANRLHDRYLFYLVPLLLISCTAMVRQRDWPRWAVFGAGALLAMAFAFMPVVRYDKFNVDSPVALLNEPLLGIAGSVNGARALLAFVTIAVTLLLMVGRRVALAVVVVGALAIPALAGGAFTRLLAHDGTSGRPITVDQSVVFDWIDRKVGTGSSVTMLPYPFLYGSYWENVAYWWNVEFWNASVRKRSGVRGRLHRHAGDLSDRSAGRRPSDRPRQRISERLRRTGRRRDPVPPVREGARRGSRRRADPHAAPMACRLARLRPVSRRLDDSEGNGHDQSLRHPRADRDRAALPDDLRAGAAGRPATPVPLSLQRGRLARRDERRGNEQADLGLRPAERLRRRPCGRSALLADLRRPAQRAVVRQLRPLGRSTAHRHRARRRGRPLLSRVSVGGGPDDDLDLTNKELALARVVAHDLLSLEDKPFPVGLENRFGGSCVRRGFKALPLRLTRPNSGC